MELFIAILVVNLLVIIILREVWCWLFKINKRIDLQRQILLELRQLNGTEPVKVLQTQSMSWVCHCGQTNPIIPGALLECCQKCGSKRPQADPHPA